MLDIKELRRMVNAAQLESFANSVINSLLDRLEEAESDAIEQARLNGMGGEREAALLAKLEATEKERDKLKNRLALVYQELSERRETLGRVCAERDALRTDKATLQQMTYSLKDRLEAAENENAKLHIALAEKVTSEATLRDLSVGNGFINATFEEGAVQPILDALADQFVESGASNYIEMQLHSKAALSLLLTLQRVDGKTPHQLRAEAEKERDALRAKIEQMERQEQVAWMGRGPRDGRIEFSVDKPSPSVMRDFNMIPLYAAPGAQPAPSIPEGWLRAIDEALIVAHIGVANESDTYEQAKAKLNNLIGFHVDVATDPAVNGGWKLVPSVPECPYPCGWRNLLKHAIEDGAYLARSINEDEPVTENARSVTMRMVMRLRDVLMTINKAAARGQTMTDHAHELRRHARKIAHPAGDVPAVMRAAADEIERLQSVIAGLRADFETAHARMMTSAEREREACAKVCDAEGREWDSDDVVTEKNYAAYCAAAIRARGES